RDLREARLSDTCLPCEEKETTLSPGSPVEPVAEYPPLALTSDELGAACHLVSVRRRRHQREPPGPPLRPRPPSQRRRLVGAVGDIPCHHRVYTRTAFGGPLQPGNPHR